jgi:hypothetical protein
MSTMAVYGILLTALFVAIIIILILTIKITLNEDETVYLDSFLDQCAPLNKNKALAERELDMLRYKISQKRFKELEDKLKYKFQ